MKQILILLSITWITSCQSTKNIDFKSSDQYFDFSEELYKSKKSEKAAFWFFVGLIESNCEEHPPVEDPSKIDEKKLNQLTLLHQKTQAYYFKNNVKTLSLAQDAIAWSKKHSGYKTNLTKHKKAIASFLFMFGMGFLATPDPNNLTWGRSAGGKLK